MKIDEVWVPTMESFSWMIPTSKWHFLFYAIAMVLILTCPYNLKPIAKTMLGFAAIIACMWAIFIAVDLLPYS